MTADTWAVTCIQVLAAPDSASQLTFAVRSESASEVIHAARRAA